MQAKKTRLTLEIGAPAQQRLKAAAASKGVTMSGYCLAAINKELALDEANGVPAGSFDIERLAALQEEAFGDKVLPGTALSSSGRLASPGPCLERSRCSGR